MRRAERKEASHLNMHFKRRDILRRGMIARGILSSIWNISTEGTADAWLMKYYRA